MFKLIKIFIWIAGFITLSLLILNYFGYELNRHYFDRSKKDCLDRLNKCKSELVRQGTENAKCDFDCIEPSLIIKKRVEQKQQNQSLEK